MRRRLLQLLATAVVIPIAGRAADAAADRLEAARGASAATSMLRRAAWEANRVGRPRSGFGRRRSPWR